jgi:hypothetical protein
VPADRAHEPRRASASTHGPYWRGWTAGAALRPISVYRLGDRHVVRDGHHRISVAGDHGLLTIEADVVERQHAAR